MYNASILASVIGALVLGGLQVARAETDQSVGVPPVPPKPALRKDAAENRKEIRKEAEEARKILDKPQLQLEEQFFRLENQKQKIFEKKAEQTEKTIIETNGRGSTTSAL